MEFNATFSNISVISWQSVLLVEYLSQVTDKRYHIQFYLIHLVMSGIQSYFSGDMH